MKKEVISRLDSKLRKAFEISKEKIHGARRDFILRLVMAMILSRSVQFPELAGVLNDEVEEESNLRRIQDFIANYQLSYLQMAVLIACFLPPGKWTLSIDRTNWKFGSQYFNILAITVYCKGVGVPLFFEILDNKGGNSNEQQRIDLLNKLLKVFGCERIGCVIGDREFIGGGWCKYLKKEKIGFYLRIKNNHRIKFANGARWRAKDLVYLKKQRILYDVEVFGCLVHVAMKKTNKTDKKGQKENLIIITNLDPQGALQAYRQRWSIEVFFQSIKKRGFRLEETHLEDPMRLKKLFAMVCLAFVSCLKIGLWKHESRKAIKVKNHGYKAKSFFRYGLDHCRKALRKIESQWHLMEEMLLVLIQDLEYNLEKFKRGFQLILEKKSFIM